MTLQVRSCHSRHRSCHRPSCSPAAPADRSGWWRSARRQRPSLRCRPCRTGRCGGRPGRWSPTRCGTSSLFRRSRYPAAGSRFRCGRTGTAPCCRTGRCGCRRSCRSRTGCAGGHRPAGWHRTGACPRRRWERTLPRKRVSRRRQAALPHSRSPAQGSGSRTGQHCPDGKRSFSWDHSS